MTTHRIDKNRHQRLTRQVEEAVSLALGASTNARLRDLAVHSVIASADASRLVIRVVLLGEASIDELERAYDALGAARAWLRSEVAADIHRKRTPELEFQVFPSWEAAP